MKAWHLRRCALLASLLFLWACLEKPYDRKKLLTDTASLVIAPRFSALFAEAARLESALKAFCQTPQEPTLQEARAVWSAFRGAWKQLEVVGFGPMMELRLRSFLDWWPVNLSGIEQEIAGTAVLDEKMILDTGAGKRGMGALESLLFVPEEAIGVTVSRFSQGEAGLRRCAYLLAISAVMTKKAEEASKSWAIGGAYFQSFVEAGRGSTVFLSEQAAFDAMINQMISLIDGIVENKLGVPLGKKSGTPRPESVEAQRSSRSIEDLRDSLRGLAALFIVREESEGLISSIRGLLLSRNQTALESKIRNEIAAFDRALAAISSPLHLAIAQETAAVDAAWEAARQLRLTLSVDLTAVLGTVVNFTDNDGD
jgi:predicted lipoprotein